MDTWRLCKTFSLVIKLAVYYHTNAKVKTTKTKPHSPSSVTNPALNNYKKKERTKYKLGKQLCHDYMSAGDLVSRVNWAVSGFKRHSRFVLLEPGSFLWAPLLMKRRLFITFHRQNIKYVRNWNHITGLSKSNDKTCVFVCSKDRHFIWSRFAWRAWDPACWLYRLPAYYPT